jgi:hypothetical protein
MAGSRTAKQFHSHRCHGTLHKVIPACTPGSWGHNDASDPDVRTAVMGDTSSPVGTGKDRCSPDVGRSRLRRRTVRLIVFDKKSVLRFLRSVALARAQQSRVKLRWVEDKSGFMRGVYSVMFWKGRPGWAEVDPGDADEIIRLADKYTEEYMRSFVEHCARGPESIKKYMEGLAEGREYSLNAVRDTYRDAAELNVDARREAAKGIETLAKYRLGSTLFVKTAALIVSLVGPKKTQAATGAIDLGYDLSLMTIDNWDTSNRARAIAVGEKYGELATDKVGEKLEEKAEEKLIEGEKFSQHVESLEKLVARYEKELVGKGPGKTARLMSRIGDRELEKEASTKAATRAFRMAKGFRYFGPTTKILFYAHDVKEAFEKYDETVKMAEEGIE